VLTPEVDIELGPGADPQIAVCPNGQVAVAAQRGKAAGIDVWWQLPGAPPHFIPAIKNQSPVNGIRKPRLAAGTAAQGGVWLAWEDRDTYLVHLLPGDDYSDADKIELASPADPGTVAVAPDGRVAVSYRGIGAAHGGKLRAWCHEVGGPAVNVEQASSDFTAVAHHPVPPGFWIISGPTPGGQDGLWIHAVQGSTSVVNLRFAKEQLAGLDDADHCAVGLAVLQDYTVGASFNGAGLLGQNGKQNHPAFLALIGPSADPNPVQVLRCSEENSQQGVKYRGATLTTNGVDVFVCWWDNRPVAPGIYFRTAVK